MSLAVVIAPYATATDRERAAIRALQCALARKGVVTIFLPDATAPYMDDEQQEQRQRGLSASEELVRLVAQGGGDVHILGDRITEGMRRDMDAWSKATPRTATFHRIGILLGSSEDPDTLLPTQQADMGC